MKRLLVIAALALTGCLSAPGDAPTPPPTAPATDAAGNRIEALTQQGDRFCTADGKWCADATGEFFWTADGSSRVVNGATREEETQAVWPFVVRMSGDRALFGITFATHTMYSGGGGSASVMTLYQVSPQTTDATPVVSLPLDGRLSIRACFSELDRGARRDACSDEYSFVGALTLDESNTADWPRFLYQTEAATYPGVRSRNADSTQDPPLQGGDMVWARDAACSYRRVLMYAPGAGGYAPDQPLPECADYLEP